MGDLLDLRSRILAAADRVVPIPVPVPEWGETVHVQRLSLPDRLEFESKYGDLEHLDRRKQPREWVEWLVRYVIATSCLADGTPIFTEDDMPALQAKAGTAIERVAISALKVNTVTSEDIAQLGKSSGEAKNGASPSASPATSDAPSKS